MTKFKFMLRSVWLFFICCMPVFLHAQIQSGITDPPLSRLENCHMVLRIRELFPFPGTNIDRIQRDTESVFLIGKEGWMTVRFRSRNGRCAEMEKFKFADGKMQSLERLESITSHPVFTSTQQHLHRLSSRDTWEYRQAHVFRERNFAGPDLALSRDVRYDYDASGRIENESFEYPVQKNILYPQRFDAIQFEYVADSVYQWMYVQGRIVDSVKYLARFRDGKRVYWKFAGSNGLVQEEKCRYDSTGKISLNEWFSNEPPLKNGVVTRPDKIEYRYDKLGRIEEIRCFVRGLRCEAYYYVYLR